MTKYVVNSGNVSGYPDKAKKFFAEVIKDLGSEPKILLCFFAVGREYWEGKFVEKPEVLLSFFPSSIHPKFFLAMPEIFEKQCFKSDVIYIQGGDDHLVQYWLRQFDLPRIWDGKVVATSSASSHALSKHFWTCDWRKCNEGMGILPIKFLAHYKSNYGSNDPRGPINWESAYKELKDCGDQRLPIYALEEGDFKVFES